ncbi:MAG: magnesium transporter, partial [Salibacteraceae bacterium]
DAADMIGELPDEKQDEVISMLEDLEQASDIVDLLNYEEGTAGALMAKELIAVQEDWNVLTCAKEMRRQGEDIDFVYTVYVVDSAEKLIGTLSVKKLLITPTQVKVRSLYKPSVISVQTSTPQEEVANIMEKYDLVVLPVVDQLGRLVGRITIDDVVDVIKEEADKDYQMASGITQDVESTDSIWVLSRARLPWLLIGLAGGIFGARVIGVYEQDIQLHPEMAYFIPLIAAMGGNVGVQSSAIIVQGLANNTLGLEGMFSKLAKEFGVALLNGLVCSILILGYNLLFSDSLNLSLTVSIALLSVIIVAGLFGTFVPLALDRYKIDPALATGPFITTMNDILGLFIYFWIGRLMYLAV